MASTHLSVNDIDLRTLRHRIEELPKDLTGHLRMGFELLAQASPEERNALFDDVLNNFREGTLTERRDGARILNLPDKIVGDALAAASITTSLLSDIVVEPRAFIEAAQSIMFDKKDENTALELATRVANQRAELKESYDIAALANAVLPSIRRLDYEIDIRLKFSEENEVVAKVPVLVGILRTDVDDELVFQATESGLTKLRNSINEALLQMQIASER